MKTNIFDINNRMQSGEISVKEAKAELILLFDDDDEWTSMDTAPKDGTVILTDEGTATYVDQKNWGSPVANGWYLCCSYGEVPSCADEGMSISLIEPKLWTKLPEPKK